jgi:hypothetical protein
MSDWLDRIDRALGLARRFNDLYDAAEGQLTPPDLDGFQALYRSFDVDGQIIFRAKVIGHVFIHLAGREDHPAGKAIATVEHWFPHPPSPRRTPEPA